MHSTSALTFHVPDWRAWLMTELRVVTSWFRSTTSSFVAERRRSISSFCSCRSYILTTIPTAALHVCVNYLPSFKTTTTVLWPFFRDDPGEPVPEENFWTLWCKGRLTEADTMTIRLGATPSGLTSAHLHHPPIGVTQNKSKISTETVVAPCPPTDSI